MKSALAALFALGLALAAGTFSAIAGDRLDLSKPVSLTCETTAVKLDSNPFEASKGELILALALDDTAAPKGPGRWKVSNNPARHTASFASTIQKTCAPDCPFTRGEDGSVQLWSPKPLALSQLDEKTALVLVTINTTTMELKASSFRNKELAGLERGDCRLTANSNSEPAEPAETEENATNQTETKE